MADITKRWFNDGTDEITCPYCGAEWSDSWEMSDSGEEICDYEFIFNAGETKVSASEAYKVIGNAVPPILAYSIGKRIASIWDDLFH